jgi:hypothetical protein
MFDEFKTQVEPSQNGVLPATEPGDKKPLVPEVPDVPLLPDEPFIPDVPDEPDVPEVPDEPLVPLEPEVPPRDILVLALTNPSLSTTRISVSVVPVVRDWTIKPFLAMNSLFDILYFAYFNGQLQSIF